MKPYKDNDKAKFPLREDPKVTELLIEEDDNGIIEKVLQEKRVKIKNKDKKLYLVKFKNQTADNDKWLTEEDIPNASTLLRRFRIEKRN